MTACCEARQTGECRRSQSAVKTVAGMKIPRSLTLRAGSTPAPGTNPDTQRQSLRLANPGLGRDQFEHHPSETQIVIGLDLAFLLPLAVDVHPVQRIHVMHMPAIGLLDELGVHR